MLPIFLLFGSLRIIPHGYSHTFNLIISMSDCYKQNKKHGDKTVKFLLSEFDFLIWIRLTMSFT